MTSNSHPVQTQIAADNCEVLRARLAKYEDAEGNPISTIAEQAREIERLRLNIAEYNEHERCYKPELAALKEGQDILILARDEQKRLANEYRELWSRVAVKAQPSGVVLDSVDEAASILRNMIDSIGVHGNYSQESTLLFLNQALGCLDEVARLNSSPVSADLTASECACGDQYPANSYGAGFMAANNGVCENCDAANSVSTGVVDERAAFEDAVRQHHQGDMRHLEARTDYGYYVHHIQELWLIWQARAALSAPSHGEQVREGWQLVPVEPTDAMLEAGDKYIGTPATYKAMLSACPSPAITKDFSQFLSAVMDAAGLIRHGRQSKELSEYLGMKCMEYRGVAPSPASQEQG
jgi:hypothetical protein